MDDDDYVVVTINTPATTAKWRVRKGTETHFQSAYEAFEANPKPALETMVDGHWRHHGHGGEAPELVSIERA